ncbi:MAG: hypothetical protein ACOCXH_09640 [Cyclobacteriaceae bacterium]
MKKCLFILLPLILLSFVSYGQKKRGFNPYADYGAPKPKRSIFRVFLNQFTWSLSSGIGATFYGATPENVLLARYNDQLYLSPGGGSYYNNWLNAPVSASISTVDSLTVNTSDNELKLRGVSTSIPLNFSVHFDITRFRIGAGISAEYHRLPLITPNQQANTLGSYQSDKSTSFFTRWYAMFGGKLYQFADIHYYLDFNVGSMGYGAAFEKTAMQKGLFFNLGVPIEYEMSEYFRLFVRPTLEFKNYTINLGDNYPLAVSQPAFYFQMGIRYNIPDTPRCPIKSCETQLKHQHKHLGSKEYRGQPFYKKQNPKIGQNYQKMHRNKNRNSRRIDGGY